jgi:fibronectin type 3 domain-containing protein
MRIMHQPILKALLFIAVVFSSVICLAQDSSKQQVALLGRSYEDHIELRYLPTSASLFNKANRLGYIIEKARKVDNKTVAQLGFKPLKGSPVKRWTDEQWETALKNIAPSDTIQLNLAGFAMALTSADATRPKPDVMENDLQSLKQSRDDADNNFSYAMIATCRSKLAAEGSGLRISDNEVEKGSRYVYRIRINEPGGNNWSYLEIQCTGFQNTYLRNDKAIVLKEGDKMINVSFPESEEYFAYNMYRSDDGGATYRRINESPEIKFKAEGYEEKTGYGFNDSGLVNYKKYYYRLGVITPFADEMILGEFMAVPKDKTAPNAPFLKSAEHIAPKKVELTWEVIPGTEADTKGFIVSRSNDEKGAYTRISKTLLPPSARTYVDEQFTTGGTNYYIVDAIDTAGNIGRSYPAYVTLIDSTPPAAPVIANAVIDSMGKVTIKVQPNKENDFMGYQLLKANAPDHEFSVVKETYADSLGATTFVLYDSTTLRTLTKNIYYQLVAFDTHFNQSLPSKVVKLTKRDTIPPVSPMITDYQVNDSSVILRFVNSESEDVVRNILLRRQKGKPTLDSVYANTDTAVTWFIDRKISPGEQYEYAMVAKDNSGLTSQLSNTIVLKTLLNNRMPAAVLDLSFDKAQHKATLQIRIDPSLERKKISAEIYKRTGDNTWMLVQTIDLSKQKIFIDTGVDGTTKVSYTTRLTDANGKQSNFSNEAGLTF